MPLSCDHTGTPFTTKPKTCISAKQGDNAQVYSLTNEMKGFAIAAAIIGAASPAYAGAYLNAESNSNFVGGDYDSTVIETHVGYSYSLSESAELYLQGGPAFVLPEDGNEETELSGKLGVVADVSDNVTAYGEVYAITNGGIDFDVDPNITLKAGLTWNF